jgi:3D-(3,5/4)-trihydroxycyclohexane-1,2-dione acylhydrolase (decyclizing)
VIGVGTRWSDFTTASRTAFQTPDVRFVNLNVAASTRQARRRAAGRRRPRGAEALLPARWPAGLDDGLPARARELARDWDATVERAYTSATARCRRRAR